MSYDYVLRIIIEGLKVDTQKDNIKTKTPIKTRQVSKTLLCSHASSIFPHTSHLIVKELLISKK